MINVAAFAGDLFALGLLPLSVVHGVIIANLAYAEGASSVHCRALYVFLLHAKAHIGPSIGLDDLGEIARELTEWVRMNSKLHEGTTVPPWVHLWVIVS